MVKAVVLGASGGIGQPLSLLLKGSPLIDELALYDVVNTPGVAADISHINTDSTVTGYLPADDGLQKALTGADIVVIPAGIPRKPGMTRDDLFKINAGIVRDLVTGVAKYSPRAFILVISNPVNSTVPIAREVLDQHKVKADRLFGVTTLDVVRASTFVSQVLGDNKPTKYRVPVVGGHSGPTIVPLLSQIEVWNEAENKFETKESLVPKDERDGLVNRIQYGGDEVVKAKDGLGSATLSMAFAGFRFAESLLKATSNSGTKEATFLKAGSNTSIKEPTFIYLRDIPGGEAIADKWEVEYLAVPVELGPNGAVKADPDNVLGKIDDDESKLVKTCLDGLKENIQTGTGFIVSTSSN